MRKTLLAALFLLLVAAAGAAAAESAAPAQTGVAPAVLQPGADTPQNAPGVGVPRVMLASGCGCAGNPLCECFCICDYEYTACEASCPPLGQPNHFNCLYDCRQDYKYCTTCPYL